MIYDIIDQEKYYNKNHLSPVSLDFLLKNSDIVSLHLPLNSGTRNILSNEKLSILKPNSILINVARGGLVDEFALKCFLKNGKIAAAAFDVFEQEPLLDNELLHLSNFFVTPHIGGSSEESILQMGLAAIEGLDNSEIPFNLL